MTKIVLKIAFLLFFMLQGLGSAAQSLSEGRELERQIFSNVTSPPTALRALKRHVRHENNIQDYASWTEYRESSKEPILKTLRRAALGTNCETFDSLSAEELISMSDEIHEAGEDPQFQCAEKLVARMDEFVRQKKSILALNRRLKPALKPCTSGSNANVSSRETLGPSKIYEISSSTSTPRLVYGPMKQCEINFTFDDGPHKTLTYQLLKILDYEKTSANFFTIGANVAKHQRIVQDTLSAGHYVGAHSQTHRQLSKLPIKDAIEDIEQSFLEIQKATNLVSIFFRFPYGASTKDLRNYVSDTGRFDFFWSMDTLDWKLKDPEALFQNVAAEINREKHGIILFHDVHVQTIAIMPELLSSLREAGYVTTLLLPADNTQIVP